MLRFIKNIFATSALLAISFFVSVDAAQALGCLFPNGGRCVPISGTPTQTEAARTCLLDCQAAGQSGCTVVPNCSGGGGGGTPAAGGAGTATDRPDPKANAKVVSLDNPIATSDIQSLVGTAVGKTFGIIGTLAVGAFIYGGFLWLTAAGNEEKVKKGGQAMVYATIGIVVIFSSFAILNTILTGLTKDSEAFLEDTGAVSPRGSLPSARPATCEAVRGLGFSCQNIENCRGVSGGDISEKRSQCDASGGACFTGICSGGNNIVCCLPK